MVDRLNLFTKIPDRTLKFGKIILECPRNKELMLIQTYYSLFFQITYLTLYVLGVWIWHYVTLSGSAGLTWRVLLTGNKIGF